jgi:hypothetical protein
VLQHGERDPVGNGKAPPNSALFSRRNAALVEVTDSGRDADDNRSILFLAGSTSFDPKAVISHIFIPDQERGLPQSNNNLEDCHFWTLGPGNLAATMFMRPRPPRKSATAQASKLIE